MSKRPIIFGTESVRAILLGRKTQTRRVVRTEALRIFWDPIVVSGYGGWRDEHGRATPCPCGVVGDQLWVRETWAARPRFIDGVPRSEVVYAATPRIGIRTPGVIRDVDHMCYLADETPLERHGFGWPIKWRSPIFMRRKFARLTLEITDVRVQRLQEISDEDAKAEGQGMTWGSGCFHRSFAGAWDSLNAKRGHGWDTNPFVWAVTFRAAREAGGGR